MSRVKAGEAFVEIGGDPRKLFAALNKVQRQIGQMGSAFSSVGRRMVGVGAGLAAPFGAAVAAGSRFQDVILAVKASAGLTAGDVGRVRDAALDMSKALGVGPRDAAVTMLELAKAGMSVENVLGGAGVAATQFAKVGNIEVSDAATVMSDAMNVFGVSAKKAVDTLSAGADSSSVSIAQLVEAFSNVGVIGSEANQSIETMTAALAILGNNMVKGGDAGTALKTMMLRLTSGADGAAEGLKSIGLSMGSFRNANGEFMPLVNALDVLRQKLDGLDPLAREQALYKIFGAYGLKAAKILLREGADGFAKMENAMQGADSVGNKFATMQGGISGAVTKTLAAIERLAIAVSDAVGPAFMSMAESIGPVIDGLTKFVTANKELIARIAKTAVLLIAVGGSFVAFGTSLRIVSFGLSGFTKAARLAISPVSMLAKTAAFTGNSFAHVFGQVGGAAVKGVSAVAKFATQSGLALARASSGFGFLAVDASISAARVSASMTGTALAGVLRFVQMGVASLAQYSAKSTALVAVSAGRIGMLGAAQVATTVSVISATVARAAEGNMRAAAIGVQALARLGVAGTTNALIAGAQVARLTSQGSTQLIRLGATGSTAIATIGSTALTVGANTTGSLAKASTTAGSALARLGSIGSVGLMSIGRSAVQTGGMTLSALMKAATVGIAQAAATTAAWVGGLARITAASAISGAAMAASFLAPFIAIGAAIAAAGVAFYAFKDQIFSALATVNGLVVQAAGAISSGFSQAVADATVVFGDLYKTGKTTFSGIYDAIANGDLAGAMDVLWAGLQAGWLRGVEALMGAVDPWISMFQNAFTILGANIYKSWDTIWVNVSNTFNTFGAYLQGAFDNVVNGVMAAWDTMEAAVRKSWNLVMSFIKKGYDLKKENDKVDSEMTARARQREVDRPGVEGRTKKAAEENAKASRDLQDRKKAVDADTEATIAGREARNAELVVERNANTKAAEARVTELTQGQSDKRAAQTQSGNLIESLGSKDTMFGVQKIAEEFWKLAETGKLTQEQIAKFRDAVGDAQERIASAESESGAVAGKVDQEAIKKAAADAAASQSEVAGTFSSRAVSGMGFGSSLQQKQLDETKRTNQILEDKLGNEKVAA